MLPEHERDIEGLICIGMVGRDADGEVAGRPVGRHDGLIAKGAVLRRQERHGCDFRAAARQRFGIDLNGYLLRFQWAKMDAGVEAKRAALLLYGRLLNPYLSPV